MSDEKRPEAPPERVPSLDEAARRAHCAKVAEKVAARRKRDELDRAAEVIKREFSK